MNVPLPAELERFLSGLVESGRYESEGEAVCAALWLLKDQEELHGIRLAELRKEIAIGLEQADRGELIDADEVFRRLRAKRKSPSVQGP